MVSADGIGVAGIVNVVVRVVIDGGGGEPVSVLTVANVSFSFAARSLSGCSISLSFFVFFFFFFLGGVVFTAELARAGFTAVLVNTLLLLLLLQVFVIMWGTETLMGTCTFKVWRAAITARGNSVTLPGGAPSGAPEGAWNVEPTAAEGREPAKAAVEGLEIKGVDVAWVCEIATTVAAIEDGVDIGETLICGDVDDCAIVCLMAC